MKALTMKRFLKVLLALPFIAALAYASHLAAHSSDQPSPAKDVKLYLITPMDGETVSETFTVRFGLSGMGVAPAGVDRPNTGHHHLLIDVDELPDLSQPLPATDNIRHFGKGQTETTITLPPGKHSLHLILGNYQHVPHNPPVISEKIEITVK